jgi:hypothetical protein
MLRGTVVWMPHPEAPSVLGVEKVPPVSVTTRVLLTG